MLRLIFIFIITVGIHFTVMPQATPLVLPADTVEVVADETDAFSIVSGFMDWYEDNINYFTIALLMAIESSFFPPIPSEMILTPAAFFAASPDNEMTFFGVILFATIGSVIGALIIYALSLWVGRKALYKFADSRMGTFLMLDSDKIKHAEDVFNKRSKTSVCLGRFIAGLRLFISIPAGLAKMNLFNFVFFTFLGSAIYNTALAFLGYYLHGQMEHINHYMEEISFILIVLAILCVAVFIIRYFIIRYRKRAIYGLVGYPLTHSFSKKYFTEKFRKERLNAEYREYELNDFEEIKKVLLVKRLRGLNVTIPYKEKILSVVDEMDETAQEIGAVNVVKIIRTKDARKITGYNTDAYGFEKSIQPYLKPHHQKALVLGTGGVSKAIDYVLKKHHIEVTFVSRDPRNPDIIDYKSVNEEVIRQHLIIINATPLGTYPDIAGYPDIPYQYITSSHILFDVVYNPEETVFLWKGKDQGALTVNGSDMLAYQAEKAWEIWQDKV